MKYNILAIADIHWGAMDPDEMYNNLQLVLDFIRLKNDIDMVVICGDYFDYRLTLNSKPALYAIRWFDELYMTCKLSGVKKLRAVKGTKEHDNDQWEAIRPKDSGIDKEDFFRKFYTCTVEESLPGLHCIYCPDETINVKQYDELYLEQKMSAPDIGFFHGNFDTLLPKLVIDQNLEAEVPSIIYFKEQWQNLINGPMISGHWHVFTDQDPLIYIGSYDRWKFGEEVDKGFLFVQYDTDDHSYFWKRIINPFARRYSQLTIDNSLCKSPEDFAELLDDIERLRDTDPEMKIKVKFQISVDDSESIQNFEEFRNVANKLKVKCDTKDLVRKEKKKKEREVVAQDTDKYSYIFENPMDIRRNLQEFIRREYGTDISLESIDQVIGKYLQSENA